MNELDRAFHRYQKAMRDIQIKMWIEVAWVIFVIEAALLLLVLAVTALTR